MNTINSLFVYGTLAPGRPNEHVLESIEGSWKEASVTGKLYKKGWGATLGYPAIILDKGGEKIEGFLFTSDNITAHWHKLDKFEGKEYKRTLTKVILNNGTKVDAYIYSLRQ